MSPSACNSVSRLCNGKPTLTLDDLFFRLYYRFTSFLLLLASVLTLLREWSVDSIDCSVPSSALPASTVVGSEVAHYRINTYCKLANHFLPVTPHSCIPLPNITTAASAVSSEALWLQLPKYQWFAWIFFVASLVLYLPHLLWKCCNQTMVNLVSTVRFARKSKSQFRFGSPDQQIKSHLQTASFSHLHLFTFFYLLSKLFNFILLIGFVYLLNHLLFEQFIYFPIIFFNKLQATSKTTLIDQTTQTANCTVNVDLSNNNYTDIFPKSSLCPYTYHVQSQHSQTILVNCLMPINSLLEQILLFIWFWFALVIIFTLFDFFRYLLLLCCRPLRIFCLKYSTNSALTPATYQLCSSNFSTWLFSTVILLSNQHYEQWNQMHNHRSLEVIEEDDEADAADVLYETVELKEVRRNTRNLNA